MKNKDYIPQNIYDFASVERLKQTPFEVIKDDVPALLEWMQDAHWDIASQIGKYLVSYVNDIAKELSYILSTDDSVWKTSILMLLIARSTNRLDPLLIKSLTQIAKHPSVYDKENAIDELAQDILDNKFLCD